MNKKKLLSLLVAGTMVMGSVAALSACNNDGGDKTAITVWVSEMAGVKTTTESQIAAFIDANEEYKDKYNVTVEGVTESEAATKMVTDVSTGADIYCFAQDQIGRLVEANALSLLGQRAIEFVESNNVPGSVQAAKVDNKLYSYPITADNGYFMYYDKGTISEEHLDDLASLVADCEAAGKKFAFELEGSAWYTASFFFATGCTSTWNYNSTQKKWSVADTFDSDKGITAMKGMQILTKSPAYVNSSKAAEFGEAEVNDKGETTVTGGAAIVVTGTWDSGTAKDKLGNNYGVAKLPKFTVDGTSYQLGSYSGYKLMGVKPHTDTTVQAFCHALAQHLSAKEAQETRFDEYGWGPSNKEVQALDKVKADPALAALNAQNAFATPQGNINGGWWDFAKLLGTATKNAALNDTAAFQEALNSYTASLTKYTTMTEEDMAAFGVVGKIASLEGVTENLAANQEVWADWGTDVKMEKTENADGTIVWKTVVKITLAAGDEFKVRQGQGWETNYGVDGGNYVVSADEAGAKYVILTLTKDGNNTVGTITLSDN